MTMSKKLSTLKYGFAAGLTTSLITISQSQAGLGQVSKDIQGQLGEIPSLFTSAAYIMGVGFTIAGLFKLKEYVDDPSSGNMKNALIRLAVGALLILIPFVITTSSDTMGAGPADLDFNAGDMNF